MRSPTPLVRLMAAAAATLLAAGCDSPSTLAVRPSPTDPASASARIDCAANVRSGAVSCHAATSSAGVRGNLIVGGQGVNVRTITGNITVVADTFAFDLAVENLMHVWFGTTDGFTADTGGVKVFFVDGIHTTQGTGTVSVANADGVDAFTASGQAFFAYHEIIAPGDTSAAKRWKLRFDPGVEIFSFSLLVSAPYPAGSGAQLDTLPSGTTTQGDTITLQVRALDAQGNPAAGVTVSWAVVDGGGSVPATSVTNADGIATAPWQTGSAALTQAVSARAGSAAPAIFVRTLDAPAASTTLVKVSGDGQQVVVHTRPSPLAVSFAQPHLPGTPVQWMAYAGGSATPFESVSVPSDPDGVSRYAWQEYNVPNQEALPAIRVVASYGGSQQEFNATLVAGPPSTVRANQDTVRLSTLGQTSTNNGFFFFHSGINGYNLNDRSQWTWTLLDNNGVIAIEQSGNISRFVRALANGTARVEAALNPAVWGTAYADTIGHDTFTVVVRQMLARVGFSGGGAIVARLQVGQGATPIGIDAGVPPVEGAPIPDVAWTSSNPAVARVNADHTVTALSPGIVAIYGTAGGATRTLYVVVTS